MKTTDILKNNERVPRKAHYHVHPRYTCGSGAMVSESVALQVAEQELESYDITMEGLYGEQPKMNAQRLGLEYIVYARWEKGRKVYRLDLLTGDEFVEPKRLEYKEMERFKELVNKLLYLTLDSGEKREYDELARRIKIHRQPID